MSYLLLLFLLPSLKEERSAILMCDSLEGTANNSHKGDVLYNSLIKYLSLSWIYTPPSCTATAGKSPSVERPFEFIEPQIHCLPFKGSGLLGRGWGTLLVSCFFLILPCQPSPVHRGRPTQRPSRLAFCLNVARRRPLHAPLFHCKQGKNFIPYPLVSRDKSTLSIEI